MIMDVNTGEWKEAGSETWPWEEDANEIMNYKKS